MLVCDTLRLAFSLLTTDARADWNSYMVDYFLSTCGSIPGTAMAQMKPPYVELFSSPGLGTDNTVQGHRLPKFPDSQGGHFYGQAPALPFGCAHQLQGLGRIVNRRMHCN